MDARRDAERAGANATLATDDAGEGSTGEAVQNPHLFGLSHFGMMVIMNFLMLLLVAGAPFDPVSCIVMAAVFLLAVLVRIVGHKASVWHIDVVVIMTYLSLVFCVTALIRKAPVIDTLWPIIIIFMFTAYHFLPILLLAMLTMLFNILTYEFEAAVQRFPVDFNGWHHWTELLLAWTYLCFGLAIYNTFFVLSRTAWRLRKHPEEALEAIPGIQEREIAVFSKLPLTVLVGEGLLMSQEQHLLILMHVFKHSRWRDFLFRISRLSQAEILAAAMLEGIYSRNTFIVPPLVRYCRSKVGLAGKDEENGKRRGGGGCDNFYYDLVFGPSSFAAAGASPDRLVSLVNASVGKNANVDLEPLSAVFERFVLSRIRPHEAREVRNIRAVLRMGFTQFFLECLPNRALADRVLQERFAASTRKSLDTALASLQVRMQQLLDSSASQQIKAEALERTARHHRASVAAHRRTRSRFRTRVKLRRSRSRSKTTIAGGAAPGRGIGAAPGAGASSVAAAEAARVGASSHRSEGRSRTTCGAGRGRGLGLGGGNGDSSESSDSGGSEDNGVSSTEATWPTAPPRLMAGNCSMALWASDDAEQCDVLPASAGALLLPEMLYRGGLPVRLRSSSSLNQVFRARWASGHLLYRWLLRNWRSDQGPDGRAGDMALGAAVLAGADAFVARLLGRRPPVIEGWFEEDPAPRRKISVAVCLQGRGGFPVVSGPAATYFCRAEEDVSPGWKLVVDNRMLPEKMATPASAAPGAAPAAARAAAAAAASAAAAPASAAAQAAEGFLDAGRASPAAAAAAAAAAGAVNDLPLLRPLSRFSPSKTLRHRRRSSTASSIWNMTPPPAAAPAASRHGRRPSLLVRVAASVFPAVPSLIRAILGFDEGRLRFVSHDAVRFPLAVRPNRLRRELMAELRKLPPSSDLDVRLRVGALLNMLYDADVLVTQKDTQPLPPRKAAAGAGGHRAAAGGTGSPPSSASSAGQRPSFRGWRSAWVVANNFVLINPNRGKSLDRVTPPTRLSGEFVDTKIERWFIAWSLYVYAFLIMKLRRMRLFINALMALLQLSMLAAGAYYFWAELPSEPTVAPVAAGYEALWTVAAALSLAVRLVMAAVVFRRTVPTELGLHTVSHVYKIRVTVHAYLEILLAVIDYYWTPPVGELRSLSTLELSRSLMLQSHAHANAFIAFVSLPLVCPPCRATLSVFTLWLAPLVLFLLPLLGHVLGVLPVLVQFENHYEDALYADISFFTQLLRLLFNFGTMFVLQLVLGKALQNTLRLLFLRTVLPYALYLDALRPGEKAAVGPGTATPGPRTDAEGGGAKGGTITAASTRVSTGD